MGHPYDYGVEGSVHAVFDTEFELDLGHHDDHGHDDSADPGDAESPDDREEVPV